MRKSVRTPPISTALLASRGKPWRRLPMSRRGAADIDDERLLQPGQERGAAHASWSGPRRSSRPGSARATSASITVPSFWVR